MIKEPIDALINELDHKHRVQRKIQFLLDIRGYFVLSKCKGDYVEFGVYQGEMIYAAQKIFSKKWDFNRYIGLDTFCGEPEPESIDKDQHHLSTGSYKETLENVTNDLKHIRNIKLIGGDFRKAQTKEKFNELKPEISMLVIDCNWVSSIKASLFLSVKHLKNGSVVYVDDMYVPQGLTIKKMLFECAKENNIILDPYVFYPPFGRAFFAFKSQN